MQRDRQGWRRACAIGIVAGVGALVPVASQAASFLIGEWRGAEGVYTWDASTGTTTLLDTQLSNDMDLNVPEGSLPNQFWFAEHGRDDLGIRTIGTSTQLFQFPTAYPKHIALFNDRVIVSERNRHDLVEYDLNGNLIRTVDVGSDLGQGIATDGTSLFLASWDSPGFNQPGTLTFQRFDENLVLQESFAAPTGLAPYGDNIFDFAYDDDTGEWWGLVTTFESGTGTNTSQLVRFQMGGAVTASASIGFVADGIGQYRFSEGVPEPGLALLLGVGALVLRRRR